MMRTVLAVLALSVPLASAAEPIPCISLNGRAYAPAAVLGITQAPVEYCRTICGVDFVWVHTAAEVCGGRLRWNGTQVDLVDWNGNIRCSFHPMPATEFWRSEEARDAYPGLMAFADQQIAPHVGAYTGPPKSARSARRQTLSAADARSAALINQYLLKRSAQLEEWLRDAKGALWMSSH